MPHKCTKCEEIFKDGDSCILTGCPNCGGKKFMYAPSKIIESKENEGLSIKEISTNTQISKEDKPDIAGKRVESVRILEPGSYEININSVLERDELVMAMKEEGTYEIYLPSIFKKKEKRKK
ncbi:MAG: Zn-ribbon domain-containing protein [Methanosarcinaceae archaeon]|nr:Zn-ribbon domain-containing protein [Methanosarcinaceae archaeon]